MRKIQIIIIIFLICSSHLIIANEIVLYPSYSTYVKYKYIQRPVENGLLTIKRLPYGLFPETIHITKPEFTSLEYTYDLDNRKSFYNSITDKIITIENENGKDTFQFLNKNDNDIYYRKGNEIILNPEGTLAAPLKELTIYPSLSVLLEDKTKKKADLEVSYLIDSIESEIQYKMDFISDSKELIISPYLHIWNNSGIDFKKINIDFIAGEPNFLNKRQYKRPVSMLRAESANYEINDSVKNQDEYYRFNIRKNANLRNNKLTVLPVLKSQKIKVRKYYRYTTFKNNIYSPKFDNLSHLEIILDFKNNTEFPFPAGKASIYEDGNLIGQKKMQTVSKKQSAEISYGKVFDITGQKIMRNQKDYSKTEILESYLIDLQNYTSQRVTIEVIDKIIFKDVRIESISHPYTKIGPDKMKMLIVVGPNMSGEIRYSIIRKRAA